MLRQKQARLSRPRHHKPRQNKPINTITKRHNHISRSKRKFSTSSQSSQTPSPSESLSASESDDIRPQQTTIPSGPIYNITDRRNEGIEHYTYSTPAHQFRPPARVYTPVDALNTIKRALRGKATFRSRIVSYIENKPSEIRSVMIALPALATMYMSYDISQLAASHIATMDLIPIATWGSLAGLGAFNALLGLSIVKGASKLLSLPGQPSEAVVEDIYKRASHQEKLVEVLGPQFQLGHFHSIASLPGGPRWADDRDAILQEWLDSDKNTYTGPGLAGIAMPNLVSSVLTKLGPFKDLKSKAAATQRVSYDILTHPDLYIPGHEQNKRLVLPASQPITGDDALRMRNSNISSYGAWSRYWTPRRSVYSTHLVGPLDEGVLITEVEKPHWGREWPGAVTTIISMQYHSLLTDTTTDIIRPNRPSLTPLGQFPPLFDTVDRATLDYAITETYNDINKKL